MTPTQPAGRHRFARLDALRGVAMLWMAAFHFAFDLNHFGLIARQDFYNDPRWTLQRTAIVTVFLFCAGLSQAAAIEAGSRHFARRWAQVAGCALLVSIGSYLMFPRSWISFGVLHGIALMLLVVRPSARLGSWLWPLGLLALLLPHVVQHPLFDARWLNWTGFVTRKPVTEDFVPLLPWLGVMWWGVAAGQWLLRERRGWLDGDVGRAARPLAALGRWPLTFYMLHQPVLIGLLLALRALLAR